MTVSTAEGDGVVWSWTIQRFAPKSPPYVPEADVFVPFTVAYIETVEGFRVEGIVEGDDIEDIRIGQRVALTAVIDDVPRYRIAEPGQP